MNISQLDLNTVMQKAVLVIRQGYEVKLQTDSPELRWLVEDALRAVYDETLKITNVCEDVDEGQEEEEKSELDAS